MERAILEPPDGLDAAGRWRWRVEARRSAPDKRPMTAGRAREYDLRLRDAGYPGERLQALLERLGDGGSLLDVGGGTGLWALPAARRGHRVTVVEANPAMRAVLDAHRAADPLPDGRLSVVDGAWPDVDVEPHDVVFAGHSLYGMADIGAALDAMTRAARRRVVVFIRTTRWPGSLARALAREQGARKLPTPNWDDLRAVLDERGVVHRVELVREPLPPSPRGGAGGDRGGRTGFPESAAWIEERALRQRPAADGERRHSEDAWVEWTGTAGTGEGSAAARRPGPR